METFERLGFEVCPPDDVEVGFERIAFFEDTDGTVSHAARQLPDGRWTSKLGTWEDVEHDTLECLEGEAYGKVAKLLRKKLD